MSAAPPQDGKAIGVLTAVLSALVVLVLLPAPVGAHPVPVPAPATVAGPVEGRLLELVNAERAAAGLTALVVDAELDAVAQRWATTMASDGVLAHNPDLRPEVAASVPSWTTMAENVGVGSDVERLHQAFMASPGHRANVLGDLDRIGLGISRAGGTIWVTVDMVGFG